MSWRQFLKPNSEILRVERVKSPPTSRLKTLKTLKTAEIMNENIPVGPIPQWQHDFCFAHAEFNNCFGQCPHSADDCLISKIIDSGDNIDNLRGLEIGQGITTDMVIGEWLNSGELAADLLKNPAWLICLAEYSEKRSLK